MITNQFFIREEVLFIDATEVVREGTIVGMFLSDEEGDELTYKVLPSEILSKAMQVKDCNIIRKTEDTVLLHQLSQNIKTENHG